MHAMHAMHTKKDRRHSGRDHNYMYDPEHGFYNETHWNDWNDHRDGFRGYNDKTKISKHSVAWYDFWNINRWNKKNKLLLDRRKARMCAHKQRNLFI